MRLPLAPAAASMLAAVVLASGCGNFEEPESAWTADEEALAERAVAAAEDEARASVVTLVGGLGELDEESATCIVDELPATVVSAVTDDDTDATRHRSTVADAVATCGVATEIAERWIPELTVEVRGLEGPLGCVADSAAAWAPGRMAELAVAGGLDEDETARDATWLSGEVDRCDAGASMQAAAATLHPQVGKDARTPRRWRCAAAAAPAGAFDELLDPAVTGDEARAAAADQRAAAWFEACP